MAKDTKRARPSAGGQGKSGSPLFAGLLVGLVIGVAVAVGVALFINRSDNPFAGKAASTPASKPAAKPEADQPPEILRPSGLKETPKDETAPVASPVAAKASSTDRFDFYTMLPGLAEKGGKDAKPANVAKPEASIPAKVEPQKGAYLQAGAFQNEQEADNLKAKLALIGVQANIQTQQLADKGLWHRVRIGPFTSLADLEKSRAQLHANGIETAIVKGN